MARDTARAYAQEKLFSRILTAYREERFDREMAAEMGALGLLGMTTVIEVFVYPEFWAMHLMWATILLFLLTKGPGAFSLDHYAGRILRAKGILA